MSKLSLETTWEALTAFSDSYTCYSSALATWVALGDGEDWQRLINAGLWLALVHDGAERFGFSHFEPGMQARLGLNRTGTADSVAEALEGVLAELERSARVIVAGDGFNLPWHVAHGRRHVPHWYVLAGGVDAPEVLDPFACRNELGLQQVTRRSVQHEELQGLLPALPREDPVLALREVFAFGEPSGPSDTRPWQWFVVEAGGAGRQDGTPFEPDASGPEAIRRQDGTPFEPNGPAAIRRHGGTPFEPDASGPEAIRRLAAHFRAHGQELPAYGQADDLWSIGRHRAFLVRRAAAVAQSSDRPELAHWVAEHGQPLAKRWGHIAPLIMQATLSLGAGRPASGSLPDTLDELAGREEAAARAFPGGAAASSI